MQETDKNKRLVYLDILNILSIFVVVAMHMNGSVHSLPLNRSWTFSLLVNTLCYFAVPIFVMISGATLMNYRQKYDTKTFFKKRLMKVLVPFLFWSILMLIWRIKTNQISLNIELINLINVILTNKEEPIYYFMFEIIGVYLTMPLISQLTDKKYRKTLWYVVIIYFILKGVLSNISTIIGISYNQAINIQIGTYVVYAILGYLLSTEENIKSRTKIIIYALAMIGLIFRFLLTYIISMKNGKIFNEFWEYSAWYAILHSIAVFIFVKDLKLNKKIEDNQKLCNIISTIANCSFGIYLIHIFVKYYFARIMNIPSSSIIHKTIGIIIVYLISLIIVYIMKKVKFVRKIVP